MDDFKDESFWGIVDKAYDCDGLIRQYVDEPDGQHGDGLAEFIVKEIGDADTVEEAIGMMDRAAAQINAVASVLSWDTLRVKDVEDLKKKASKENGFDGFILLQGGLKSSKHITYASDEDIFYVTNFLDGTDQELSSEELFTESNIGRSIKNGIF